MASAIDQRSSGMPRSLQVMNFTFLDGFASFSLGFVVACPMDFSTMFGRWVELLCTISFTLLNRVYAGIAQTLARCLVA
jgi:hypothetical protein